MKENERAGLRRGIAGQVAAGLTRGLPIQTQQVAETAVQVATAVVDLLALTEEREEQARLQAAAEEKAKKDAAAGVTTVEPH